MDAFHIRELRVPATGARPDFVCEPQLTLVYVDGPVHDFVDRQQRAATQQTALEDLGFTVLRFHHEDDWATIIDRYPDLFGTRAERN